MSSSNATYVFKSTSSSSCSTKLSTVVKKIDSVQNHENASIISHFHKYMEEKGSSENHQVNTLKVMIELANYLGPTSFKQICKREEITSFLNKKIKTQEEDPDRKCITTWNHYLNRIKLFFRWLFNYYLKQEQTIEDNEEWITPTFCKIKMKQTKRVSPYLESEIWERSELVTLLNYESNLRNKAVLSLMWDLNARPHEITLLKIKNLRLKDKYGEGEIPFQAKTGSGPILLMLSFPYVRDLLNQHPFKNEPNDFDPTTPNNENPVVSVLLSVKFCAEIGVRYSYPVLSALALPIRFRKSF